MGKPVDKTRLDQHNPHHQKLIYIMAQFVEDYGYTPHELFQLMNHSQGMMFGALSQIHSEVKEPNKT